MGVLIHSGSGHRDVFEADRVGASQIQCPHSKLKLVHSKVWTVYRVVQTYPMHSSPRTQRVAPPGPFVTGSLTAVPIRLDGVQVQKPDELHDLLCLSTQTQHTDITQEELPYQSPSTPYYQMHMYSSI
jgi:hypothetical protein